MQYEKMKSADRGRRRIKKVLKTYFKKYRKNRGVMKELWVREWLDLDNYNSYQTPVKLNQLGLKGEAYRFACVLFALAKEFGNGFNFSDREFVGKYGFHSSRISFYKTKLEDLGLIIVAYVKIEGLSWPKSQYRITSFWNE